SFATAALHLSLWDVGTSQERWSVSPDAAGATLQLAFSPDGRQVLARLMDDDSVRLFETKTGMPTTVPLRHQGRVNEAAFGPAGRLVLPASGDRTARLWDATLGLPVGPVWSSSLGPRAAFVPDGKSVLLWEDTGISRWEIVPPIEGSPERIRLAVEAA